MSLTINGTSLAGKFWNVSTLGPQLSTAGRRGENSPIGTRDGTAWRSGKALDQLVFPISMWITGANTDGTVPALPAVQMAMRSRLDSLYRMLGDADALAEIVDPASGRRCYGEVTVAIAPRTMAAGSRAEVELEVVVPAGSWQDVTEITSSHSLTGSGGTIQLPAFVGGNLPLVDLMFEITGPATTLRLTTDNGSWLEWTGVLPTAPRIVTGPRWRAYANAAPNTSLLSALTWGPRGTWSIPSPATGNPTITWTATGTSGASAVLVRGRRRYRSA